MAIPNTRVARRLAVSLENEDGEELENEVMVDGEETVEGKMAEVDEAEAEVETEEEAGEELEEAAEGLESIANQIEASLEDGGLTPGEAVYMNIAVESYTNRLGIAAPIVASQESFGGSSDRLTSTQVSLEGLKEIVSQIWDKIKELWASLVRKLAEWYLKIFDAAPKLRKKAEAIQKKASDTSGNAKEDKIKVGGVAKKLHVGGKVGDLKKASEAVASNAANRSKETVKWVNDFATIIEGIANKPGTVEKLEADVAVPAVKNGNDDRFGKDMNVELESTLPGGKAYYQAIAKSGNAFEQIRSYRVGMIDASKKDVSVDTDQEIKTLSLGDIDKICDNVIKIANAVENYKREWEERKKAVKNLEKAGDKAEKSSKGDDLKQEQSAMIRQAVRAAGNYGKVCLRDGSDVASYSLTTGKALLAVCQKSLSQYK